MNIGPEVYLAARASGPASKPRRPWSWTTSAAGRRVREPTRVDPITKSRTMGTPYATAPRAVEAKHKLAVPFSCTRSSRPRLGVTIEESGGESARAGLASAGDLAASRT